MPRPPTTQATTWRVCLQSAIQAHRLLRLHRTNDHISSSSSCTASGFSGVTSVALSGGVVAAFFEPFRYCGAGHAECSGQPTHTRALLIRLQYLIFLRFAVPFSARVLATGLAARSTQVLLLAVWCMTVLDKLFALAVAATYNFGDHSLAYQSLLNHYPKELLGQGWTWHYLQEEVFEHWSIEKRVILGFAEKS